MFVTRLHASGNADDRQSLVHLLWFADALDIRGILPDRRNARGNHPEAAAYAKRTLENRRQERYGALLQKLARIYERQ